jgi:hypothetical protein
MKREFVGFQRGVKIFGCEGLPEVSWYGVVRRKAPALNHTVTLTAVFMDVAEGGAERSLSGRCQSRRSFRVPLSACKAGGSGFALGHVRLPVFTEHRNAQRPRRRPRVAITRGDATRNVRRRRRHLLALRFAPRSSSQFALYMDVVEGGAKRSLSERCRSRPTFRVALSACEAGGSG